MYEAMPSQANPDSWVKSSDTIRKLPDLAILGLRSARWLVYERRLRERLRRGEYDIYHETSFTPSNHGGTVPQVFTLHDLSLMHYAQYHPKERVWFFKLFFERRLARADTIIVPSEFIGREVRETLKLPESKVAVIPEAPDPFFSRRSPEAIRSVREKLSLPDEYILFVGTLEPRKNLDLLIDAMALCESKVPLVLTGWQGWGDKPWVEKARKSGVLPRIHRTGYIDEESLACLYSDALAMIYPSHYEGFGLPVLEAMACGTPVICSNAASLPEAGGDAALYVDPNDADDLAAKIDRVLTDQETRRTMAEQGLLHASRFSWSDVAVRTVDVFRQAASSKS
ncbi:MAG: glycosyltransferase family 4 protein [Oceanidesulfovibrio sp.]